ncbi:unnamed protein product [Diamesa hyperborea]
MNLKFSLLVICVLCLLINLGSDASTIRNTFVDNISTGLKLAEKLLGKNSRRFPTFSQSHNVVKPLPGISNNVADLVSQSFAPTPGNVKRLNTRQDAITIGETPELPGPMDSNIMGGMLRLLGLDSTKIGAAAVNGIVFIAQMQKKTKINKNEEQTDKMRILMEEPIDWILKNEKVASMLTDVRDKELPNKLMSMVKSLEQTSGDADCILLLLCKLKPIFWGMQKAIDAKILGNEEKTNSDDIKPNRKRNRRNILFKNLPNLSDFQNNGLECEEVHNNCKLF